MVRIPSQGHWWRDLGSQPLAGRAPGVFHSLAFTIPEDLRAALDSNATDVDYRVILNVPSGSESYLVDHLVVSDAVPNGGAPSTTSEVAFGVSVPQGLTVADVMISGTSRVTIDDRSDLAQVNARSQVANLGTSALEVGAQVDVFANITSVGNVNFLRSQSHTRGDVTTAGTVTRQDGSVLIDGTVTEHATVQPVTTSWAVDWPTGATNDLSCPPDSPNLAIAPGTYDSIQIFSRATVTFRSGAYFINALVAEPEAHLRIDASDGPVQLFVRDTLQMKSSLTFVAGATGDAMFVFAGQGQALFQEAIEGTVLAPNGTIELRRPSTGAPHVGAFFAKHVHVFSDAAVFHRAFDTEGLCGLIVDDPERTCAPPGPIDPDRPSAPALTAHALFQPSATPQQFSSLTYRIVNRSPVARAVQWAVRSSGLDGRRSMGPARGATVPAQGSVDVEVPLALIPIQSLGSPSIASFRLVGPDGDIVSLADEFFYDFADSTYSRIRVFNLDGAIATYPVPEFEVQGQVLVKSGEFLAFTDVSNLIAQQGGQRVGPQYFGYDEASVVSDQLRGTSQQSAPTKTLRVCVKLHGAYVDTGRGEDRLLGSEETVTPASFLRVKIEQNYPHNLVFDGYLDVDGCTPPATFRTTDLANVHVIHELRDTTNDVGVKLYDYFLDLGISRYALGTTRLAISPTNAVDQLDVALGAGGGVYNLLQVAGTLLQVGSNQLGGRTIGMNLAGCLEWDNETRMYVRIPDSCANTQYDEPMLLGGYYCPGGEAVDACVFIGPGVAGLPSQEKWKYIVAHELGHVAQSLSFGLGRLEYDEAESAVAACRCDHVTVANGRHCLQSMERAWDAFNEGFAHYYATLLMNAEEPNADGIFTYYKESFDSALTAQFPPQGVASHTWYGWRDTHCNSGNYTGTELDWLAFLWQMSTQGAGRVPYAELHDVMVAGCTDGVCTGEEINFDTYELGAEELYGLNSTELFQARQFGRRNTVDNPD